MYEPLRNRTFLVKKINFLGADFLAPKIGHHCVKKPILGPVRCILENSCSGNFMND